jgi:hypothetical protein
MRLIQAIQTFFRVLFNGEYAERLETVPVQPPAALPAKTEPAALPPPPTADLQILVLLQREGRLLDFLKEDIDGYDDAQVGAAVRAIHKGCRKVVTDVLTVQPIRTEGEGAKVVVPSGFDPASIRLIGNVRGEPPFNGVLKHHGWQVLGSNIPAVPPGQDPRIIAPAEVELR